MEFKANARAVPHADALFTQLCDGDGVLLDMQTHAYYGLNQTACRIWELMVEGVTLVEIPSRLKEEFEASDEELQEAVAEFAQELIDANLVELTD